MAVKENQGRKINYVKLGCKSKSTTEFQTEIIMLKMVLLAMLFQLQLFSHTYMSKVILTVELFSVS